MTSCQHGCIIQAYKDNRTFQSIADQFGCAPSKISRGIHGASQQNEGTRLLRTGRPPYVHTLCWVCYQRRLFWSYDKIRKWYGFTQSKKCIRVRTRALRRRKITCKGVAMFDKGDCSSTSSLCKTVSKMNCTIIGESLFPDKYPVECGALHCPDTSSAAPTADDMIGVRLQTTTRAGAYVLW
jgi:hypothetical protein